MTSIVPTKPVSAKELYEARQRAKRLLKKKQKDEGGLGSMSGEVLSSRNVFRTYRQYDLDFKSQKEKCKLLEDQLNVWIRKSGPGIVRAVSYDHESGGRIYIPDETILMNINTLTISLGIEKENLLLLEASFEKQKKLIRDACAKFPTDTIMQVFKLAWVDGKSNEVIAVEMQYSIQNIKYYKTQIYNLMQELSAM